jgi:hypothetical protein
LFVALPIFAFLSRCCPCIFVALTHCIVLHSCCCVPYYLCVTCLSSSLAAPAEHLWAFVSILVPELHLEAISASTYKESILELSVCMSFCASEFCSNLLFPNSENTAPPPPQQGILGGRVSLLFF